MNRPRHYWSNAERQKAYRKRVKRNKALQKSRTNVTLKPMPCTKCGYESDGKDWLDNGATCPKCKLVQGF